MITPNFDHNNVIPPHTGDPTSPQDVSPYKCDSLELCKRFATSPQRNKLLLGLLDFRQQLAEFGILEGFQWLDGSFLENIEVSQNRSPNDIDVVTFFIDNGLDVDTVFKEFPEFIYAEKSKSTYGLDHYPVDFGHKPELTVESSRYWIQLFSHNRLGIWKGMIRLELNTPTIDLEALNYLKQL